MAARTVAFAIERGVPELAVTDAAATVTNMAMEVRFMRRTFYSLFPSRLSGP